MKYILLTIALLFSLNIFGQSRILTEDLQMIIGSWEGSLTYLDYSSGEPYTMPANLIVEQGKNEWTLVLKNSYPKEPKANDSDKFKVSSDGTSINKSAVTSREILADGQIQIQTEYMGKDDRKMALIRNTYLISKDHFMIRKDVQFEGTDEWIKRNEMEYRRKM